MTTRTAPPEPSQLAQAAQVAAHDPAAVDALAAYGRSFWFTYAANLMLMVAISLLYRYADFVTFLGGSELDLGLIVGIGAVGSLLMRFAQGIGIDRYGTRRVWLASNVVFVGCCVAHLLVSRVDTPLVYVLRVVLSTSVAGVFGASITHASLRSPTARLAEVLGTLGTSGFIGMIVGTYLGDLLLGTASLGRPQVDRMFLVAAGLGCLGGLSGWIATRGDEPPAPRRRIPFWPVIKRYQPGAILLVGMATGFGVGLPSIFLRTYAAHLSIHKIGAFFTVYAVMAFATRIAIRRLPERIGIRPTALIGLLSLAASMLLFIPVALQWQLIAPAIFLGIAHAMLFPSVVAGGSSMFPTRYRGLGTTLMLASVDLGGLVGAPAVGLILEHAGYTTMFVSVAAILGSVILAYALERGGVSRLGARRER